MTPPVNKTTQRIVDPDRMKGKGIALLRNSHTAVGSCREGRRENDTEHTKIAPETAARDD